MKKIPIEKETWKNSKEDGAGALGVILIAGLFLGFHK